MVVERALLWHLGSDYWLSCGKQGQEAEIMLYDHHERWTRMKCGFIDRRNGRLYQQGLLRFGTWRLERIYSVSPSWYLGK